MKKIFVILKQNLKQFENQKSPQSSGKACKNNNHFNICTNIYDAKEYCPALAL